MSRIGIKPITIPDGITVDLKDNLVTFKGKTSTLTQVIHSNIIVEIADKTVNVKRKDNNMVEGVSKGFKKVLEVNGVGYRVQKQGKNLVMNLGYSHQVTVPEIDGIKLEVEGNNKIIVSGADKQKVGQIAAEIREKRPPEPYKGKGIKYENEHIRRKEGKAGKGKK